MSTPAHLTEVANKLREAGYRIGLAFDNQNNAYDAAASLIEEGSRVAECYVDLELLAVCGDPLQMMVEEGEVVRESLRQSA